MINGILGSFKAGEIGEILPNTFPEKYDWLIRLPGRVHADNFLGDGPIDALREFFFYADEIELIYGPEVSCNI